jgi:hypothetical protein
MDSNKVQRKRPIVVTHSLVASLRKGTCSIPTESGCLEWTMATVDGYGVIGVKKEGKAFTLYAHRVAWVVANEQPIPDHLVIAHKCDNRSCVNPDHLECVTESKNIKDSFLRGGAVHFCGEQSWNAVLTDKKVRSLRVLHHEYGMRVCWLAKQFGINPRTIHRAIYRRTWRHVS